MKKKNNYNLFYIGLISGVSLIVFIGILLAGLILSNDNAYFARIRVAIKKKVQIVYNYNLFDLSNSNIKEYNSETQTITLNNKLKGNIELGELTRTFKKGDKYRVTINYLSGSYDKKEKPQFVFELQKDNEYYEDRKNGTHYIAGTLPTKDKTYDKVITIKKETKDASNIIYRLYQENEVEYKNYKIQISITKLESKIGVAGEKYGKLPTPEKDGYEFLGWYDSISGGKKVTETNTILKKYNHPLYAHWEAPIISSDEFTIKYNCNGGTDGPDNEVFKNGEYFVPAVNTCKREGYETFAWYTPKNEDWTFKAINELKNGSNGVKNNVLVLKAKWAKKLTNSNFKKPNLDGFEKISCKDILNGGTYPKETEKKYCQYESDTLIYYIVKPAWNYYLTYVWVKDAQRQLKMAIAPQGSSNTISRRQLFKSGQIIGREVYEKKYDTNSKGLIGVNANPMVSDQFYTGAPYSWKYGPAVQYFKNNGVLLRNSIYEDYWVPSATISGLSSDGAFKTYFFDKPKTVGSGKPNTHSVLSYTDSQKLINQRVVDYIEYTNISNTVQWSGFYKKYITDGNKTIINISTTGNVDKNGVAKTGSNPAVCQVDLNNFIFITPAFSNGDAIIAGNGDRAEGRKKIGIAPMKMMKDELVECMRGFMFDGGGSTAIWAKSNTKDVNGPGRAYDGRDSADVFYFVEQ